MKSGVGFLGNAEDGGVYNFLGGESVRYWDRVPSRVELCHSRRRRIGVLASRKEAGDGLWYVGSAIVMGGVG
jgi:hypothetical protein